MYRYNKTISVPYLRQGLIYFWSHNYAALSEKEKNMVKRICRKAGGEYEDALLAYMTTNASSAKVCMDHFIERSHLFRIVRKYYIVADEYMK